MTSELLGVINIKDIKTQSLGFDAIYGYKHSEESVTFTFRVEE
jgi:hypothetical protein